MNNKSEIRIDLQDTEWEMSYIDHDREIVRAVVFDDEDNYYFVRALRDDDFGKATLIETSGGGVENGEDLLVAIRRELYGRTVIVHCSSLHYVAKSVRTSRGSRCWAIFNAKHCPTRYCLHYV